MKSFMTCIFILAFSNLSSANESLDQYFTFMGFTLEESNISDVVEKLGDTIIHREGDAAESYTGVCYHSIENDVTIFFESGEMGGGKILLGYKVVQGLDNKYPCREISGLPEGSFNIGDLSIGENLESAINRLPQNIESRDGLSFFYTDKIPFTEEEIKDLHVQNMEYAFWFQGVTIQLFANKNKVSGYSIYKVTSW